MNKLDILLVDDDDHFAQDFMLLGKKAFTIQRTDSGEKALQLLQENQPDAVLLDLQLGSGMDGIQTLQAIKQFSPDLPVIIITEYAGFETAVQAMKLGALHYAAKHPNIKMLQLIIEQQLQHLRWKKLYLGKTQSQTSLIGSSAPMKQLKRQIEQVADSDITVVIEGESGSGKELVAQEIHQKSARADMPFVAVNCSGIAPSLFESELFGHEKGAFTNAYYQRKGYFELADKGTLFLDEIADMDITLQAKLLRVLQNQSFVRVGGQKEVQVDVRVLAASNKSLVREVEAGRFREDLFYRLNVVTLSCPPLRERRDDIPELVNSFSALCQPTKSLTQFSKTAMSKLKAHAWPGNVRELRNVVERTLAMNSKAVIDAEDISFNFPHHAAPDFYQHVLLRPYADARHEILEKFKCAYVNDLLQRNQGRVAQAAREAGIPRPSLHRMIKECGLDS